MNKIKKRLVKRYYIEKIFKGLGFSAVLFAFLCVVFLLGTIFIRGAASFVATEVQLEVHYESQVMELESPIDEEDLEYADYASVLERALLKVFPGEYAWEESRQLFRLLSPGAESVIYRRLSNDSSLLGKREVLWLPASRSLSKWKNEGGKRGQWASTLYEKNYVRKSFNGNFFKRGDSRNASEAGIKGALLGSFFTLVICFLLSFPLGIGAALYLEEFAPKTRWIDIINVNINNLAAVPSIIFGLLGLAIFINFFSLPRSVPLIGGMVLALMTLPTIIITSRAAIQSVPFSVREAALGLGASHMQVVFSHVLPLAMPGILTGTIIGIAQALGETAPLLMIGMVAFIVDIPEGFLSPATVLPVQIFLWADNPEQSFVELTSGAIMVLLLFLFIINISAVFLRQKMEKTF